MTIREKLKDFDITMIELSKALKISRQSLYNYLDLYENKKYDDLPSMIRRVFDYISDSDFTSLNNISVILYGADPTKERSEENPLVWSSRVYVKTDNRENLLKILRKNKFEVIKNKDGSYRFEYYSNNHNVRFVLLGDSFKDKGIYNSAKTINGLDDIKRIFKEESSLAYKSYRSGVEKLDNDVLDIPLPDELLNPSGDLLEEVEIEEEPSEEDINWFEYELLKSEVVDTLRKESINKPEDIYKLQKINELLKHKSPDFEIVQKGKMFVVIKPKNSDKLSLCFVTKYSDPLVPPIAENSFYTDDAIFYRLCDGGDELVPLMCDMESRIK